MKKVTEQYFCDICEKEIVAVGDLMSSEKRMLALINIAVDAWYQGVFSPSHICTTCQDSIINHIRSIAPRDHLAKGWTKI